MICGDLNWIILVLNPIRINSEREHILQVSDLKTHFVTNSQTVKAVNGIDFNLYKGETLGIVGESGSGKSVSMLSILQMVDPPGKLISGEAIFCNGISCVDLLRLSEKEITKIRGADIGMIYQHAISAFNPIQKIGKQLSEAIRIHNKSAAGLDKKLVDLLKRVQLDDPARMLNAYPHQLSGGQLQRCMIAMSIVNSPTLLIADEPTTALDVITQRKILNLLHDIKEEMEMSMILISHDLGVIKEMADCSLVMRNGRIIEEALVTDLFDQPKSSFTKALINSRPSLEQKYHRLPITTDFENNSSYDGAVTISHEEIQNRRAQLDRQKTIIKVTGLSKTYGLRKSFFSKTDGVVKAVDNVSFELREGEVLGVVGESGSGKSTLARLMLRLEKADRGAVQFEDKSIFDLNKKDLKQARKDLQIIFQDVYGSLDPKMSVYRSIEIVLAIHFPNLSQAQIEKRVQELLNQVGLSEAYQNRLPHELSGGERQRVCIARALSVNPKVLICDECVSALDITIQAQILNLLLDIRDQQGLSIVFISHDLAVINFMADRVLVMQLGEIVEEGYPEVILKNPKQQYTQELLDAVI